MAFWQIFGFYLTQIMSYEMKMFKYYTCSNVQPEVNKVRMQGQSRGETVSHFVQTEVLVRAIEQ